MAAPSELKGTVTAIEFFREVSQKDPTAVKKMLTPKSSRVVPVTGDQKAKPSPPQKTFSFSKPGQSAKPFGAFFTDIVPSGEQYRTLTRPSSKDKVQSPLLGSCTPANYSSMTADISTLTALPRASAGQTSMFNDHPCAVADS